MGQRVAPGVGLTARQEQFLAVVQKDPEILRSFYLTGGTALSSWYLHHRESYDLDSFAKRVQPNAQYLTKWIEKHKGAIGYTAVKHDEQFGFNFYTLTFPGGDRLKVDFSYYPSIQLRRSSTWKGLTIDSLYDIAVNKFETIGSSPRGRDYVDLYCIVREKGWSLDELRRDAQVKFGMHYDPLHLVRQFLRVVEFTDLPTMLMPFERSKMDSFFADYAKSIKDEVLTE